MAEKKTETPKRTDRGMSELAANVAAKMKKQLAKQDMKKSANALHLVDALGRVRPSMAIPTYCLPFEYALGQVGIPLGKILTIQGETESSKSSLFWWMARMFLAHGGQVVYFDLENKHDDGLAMAYIGNPAARIDRVSVFQLDCVDAFASTLSSLGNEMLRAGITRPTLVGVDTLGATLTDKFMTELSSGKSVVGYSAAQAIMQLQAALQSFVNRYMNLLPITLCCLQQEKVKPETGEVYATGGKNAGFARSTALQMRRIGTRKSLDLVYPTLRLGQVKQSSNVKRSVNIVMPTDSSRVGEFRDYHFRWQYSLLQLLVDLPASYLEGLCKVARDTEQTFSVTPAKDCILPDIVKHSKANFDIPGTMLFNNQPFIDLMRERTDLVHHRVYPYDTPGLASPLGGLWVGPEETEYWQSIMAEGPEAVAKWHSANLEKRREEAGELETEQVYLDEEDEE